VGSLTSGVPLELARGLQEALGLTRAVETGTFRGDSAAALATCFADVWTIELSGEFFAAASRRFAANPRVHPLEGSSLDHLPALAASPDAALYWLDGHWSGDSTAGEALECPVLGEIACIDSSDSGARSCILIDDARFFLGPPLPPHKRDHWPTLTQLFDALRSRHERYLTIIDDVVIAVPLAGRDAVDVYWLNRGPQRGTPSRSVKRRLYGMQRWMERQRPAQQIDQLFRRDSNRP
jgi:hypothetical protein